MTVEGKVVETVLNHRHISERQTEWLERKRKYLQDNNMEANKLWLINRWRYNAIFYDIVKCSKCRERYREFIN